MTGILPEFDPLKPVTECILTLGARDHEGKPTRYMIEIKNGISPFKLWKLVELVNGIQVGACVDVRGYLTRWQLWEHVSEIGLPAENSDEDQDQQEAVQG